MNVFGVVRVVRMLALDALGRLVVQGTASLPAAPFLGVMFGSATAHLVYMAQPGDQLVLARTAGGTDLPIATSVDPAAEVAAQGFAGGDLGIRMANGAVIRVSAAGDIYLLPAPGRAIYVNGGSANVVGSGAHVTVSGTVPSGGGSVTLTGSVDGAGNAGMKV